VVSLVADRMGKKVHTVTKRLEDEEEEDHMNGCEYCNEEEREHWADSEDGDICHDYCAICGICTSWYECTCYSSLCKHVHKVHNLRIKVLICKLNYWQHESTFVFLQAFEDQTPRSFDKAIEKDAEKILEMSKQLIEKNARDINLKRKKEFAECLLEVVKRFQKWDAKGGKAAT
jgi:hypothetical protein